MKKEIKEYLEGLETKFNDKSYQAYEMKNNKISEIGTESTQSDLNKLITNYVNDNEDIENIIKVSYGIYIKKYMIGPLSITVSVVPVVDNKLSKKNIKTNTVFFTEEELETYKLRKGDFKLIVKGLINESIESNPFKKYTRKDIEGLGIMSTIKNITNKTKNYINSFTKKTDDYSSKVKDIINKKGNQTIIGITIGRTPVPSILVNTINLISLNEFNKNLKNSPYDKLFHLFIRLKLDDGSILSLEKNEVINMDIDNPIPPNTETQDVLNIPQNLTVNILLENTKRKMGNKYFTYSARDNNCQDFIKNVFESNNIGNQQNIEFIKQDTKQLFGNNKTLRKITNTVTDIGALVNPIIGSGLTEDIIKHFDKDNHELNKLSKSYKKHLKVEKQTGGSLNQKHIKYYNEYIENENDYKNNNIVQSIIFNKDKYTINDCKNWLLKNGYKLYKVDETENTYRWRQFKPKNVKKNGFNIYKNKNLKNGIILVIAYKNNISTNNIMKKKYPKHKKGHGFNSDSGSDSGSDSDSDSMQGTGRSGSYTNDVVNRKLMIGGGLGTGLYAGAGLYAGEGLYAGAGVIHHHHHHYINGGKINFKNIGHSIEHAFTHPSTNEKVAAHYIIPGVTGAIGSTLGGPLGGMAGAYAGTQANKALGIQNDTTFKTGKGLGTGRHPHPHINKGSKAALEWGARMKALREAKKR